MIQPQITTKNIDLKNPDLVSILNLLIIFPRLHKSFNFMKRRTILCINLFCYMPPNQSLFCHDGEQGKKDHIREDGRKEQMFPPHGQYES